MARSQGISGGNGSGPPGRACRRAGSPEAGRCGLRCSQAPKAHFPEAFPPLPLHRGNRAASQLFRLVLAHALGGSPHSNVCAPWAQLRSPRLLASCGSWDEAWGGLGGRGLGLQLPRCHQSPVLPPGLPALHRGDLTFLMRGEQAPPPKGQGHPRGAESSARGPALELPPPAPEAGRRLQASPSFHARTPRVCSHDPLPGLALFTNELHAHSPRNRTGPKGSSQCLGRNPMTSQPGGWEACVRALQHRRAWTGTAGRWLCARP